MIEDKLMTRKEAAAWLGVAPGTLSVWKCTKRYNLPVIKIGKLARYRLSDLQEFVKQNAVKFEHAK